MTFLYQTNLSLLSLLSWMYKLLKNFLSLMTFKSLVSLMSLMALLGDSMSKVREKVHRQKKDFFDEMWKIIRQFDDFGCFFNNFSYFKVCLGKRKKKTRKLLFWQSENYYYFFSSKHRPSGPMLSISFFCVLILPYKTWWKPRFQMD